MKNKITFIIIIILIFSIKIHADLKFNPISLNKNDEALFNSIEILSGKEYNRTLFYGYYNDTEYKFEALSFYPENLFYSETKNILFIQNRMGLYYYDFNKNSVQPVNIYPNFENKDEYVIFNLSKLNFAPNYKYLLGKIPKSNVKSDIYLYDLEKNSVEKIITDVDTNPGEPIGFWSNNSKYFVYEKNHKTYYFSINDYKRNKLLQEDWRIVGKVKLNNTFWTDDDYLIWIEDNLIYKADSRQFYSRSIYKSYLRLGHVIGKIPFNFDSSFDSFIYNNLSGKFLIVKKYKSVFFYSLYDDMDYDPYLQLDDMTRFDRCEITDNGNGIILIKKLNKGKIENNIILIKKNNNNYEFKKFNPEIINNAFINNFTVSKNKNNFVLNTSKGAYCFDLITENLIWKYENEEIIESVNLNNKEWIIGGKYTTLLVNPESGKFIPLFASSFDDAGIIGNDICIKSKNNSFIINKNNKILIQYNGSQTLIKDTKTDIKRLITRELKMGFYSEGIYIKDLYSGKLLLVTGVPNLKYTLYQPELELGVEYYNDPSGTKYEIALVFDCIKTDEGIFPILVNLDKFKTKATFFISGNFMEINPEITKEITYFDLEIGNLFQYYVDLTDNNFLIDKNFIRQGLSANEEIFYKLTGKNFSPIWHSPKYAYNESIVKYGEKSGYKYVTFNLDSFDWVGETNDEIKSKLYMSSSEIILRLLENIKPGKIIIFSTGKNDSVRNDWLFNNLDLLISELIRAGYSFTTVSDLLKKYRKN